MTDQAMPPATSPEEPTMATETPTSVEFTAEQVQSLFGGEPVPAGETRTLVLKGGDVTETGAQTFSIEPGETAMEASVGDAASDAEELPESPAEPAAEESSPEEEQSMLGYDRAKLTSKKRQKKFPKLSASDLYDA